MTSRLEKFIKSLDKKTKDRLKKKLNSIKSNPRKGANIKRLQGAEKDLYRLRTGKIRVIYKIVKNEVQIIDIDYRGNIY